VGEQGPWTKRALGTKSSPLGSEGGCCPSGTGETEGTLTDGSGICGRKDSGRL